MKIAEMGDILAVMKYSDTTSLVFTWDDKGIWCAYETTTSYENEFPYNFIGFFQNAHDTLGSLHRIHEVDVVSDDSETQHLPDESLTDLVALINELYYNKFGSRPLQYADFSMNIEEMSKPVLH